MTASLQEWNTIVTPLRDMAVLDIIAHLYYHSRIRSSLKGLTYAVSKGGVTAIFLSQCVIFCLTVQSHTKMFASADMSLQIDNRLDKNIRFRKFADMFAAVLYMLTRGRCYFRGTLDSLNDFKPLYNPYEDDDRASDAISIHDTPPSTPSTSHRPAHGQGRGASRTPISSTRIRRTPIATASTSSATQVHFTTRGATTSTAAPPPPPVDHTRSGTDTGTLVRGTHAFSIV